MSIALPAVPAAYLRTVNAPDSAAFLALFADNVIVEDAGRELRGIDAVKAWSDSDIFAARVTLEPLGVSERDDQTVVTTKVDGNFDRTGLPDPVIIDHYFRVAGGKIISLKCRLAG